MGFCKGATPAKYTMQQPHFKKSSFGPLLTSWLVNGDTIIILSHSYSIWTDYKIGLRLSVSVSVYPAVGSLTVAFLDRFLRKLAQT